MENKSTKRGKKGIVIATIAILIFGGIAAYNLIKFTARKNVESKREEKIPVQVTELKFIDMDWTLDQTGTIRPKVEVNVYPKVPGKIIKDLLVEKGDYIKKGALIAILEDDTIKAQIEETKAGLESAMANLEQVEANLEMIEKDRTRLESLYREKAVAKQRLDHIGAKHKATIGARGLAEARIKGTEAVLERLGILFRDHRTFAPIAGHISARYVDRGSMSSMQQPIIRISDDREVKIITVVTEMDFPHIKKGMKVEIKVDAFPERIFPGTVSIISPTIDPATRTGEIEVHISNRNLTLKSGMFARVRLYLGQRNALAVTRDALNRFPGTGSYYVYVVEDGKAVLKNIRTGLGQGNDMELTEGLEMGEKVVVKGQNRLKAGSPVFIEGMESKVEERGRVDR